MNRSYQSLAEHYQLAVIPARPRKPQDKSRAENGVLLAERWILAKLRHESFFSLGSLNARIKELLQQLNDKPFQKLPGSRRSQYEILDQPVLRALPRHRYQYVAIKKVKVGVDYHVEYERHFYSVPHQLVGQYLEVHASANTVRVYQADTPVAVHPRRHQVGFTTNAAHMPPRHRAHGTWNAPRLLSWGKRIGPHTERFVQQLLDDKAHPEQAYRACLGLLNLSRQYGDERLENACQMAHSRALRQLKHVRNLLKHDLVSPPSDDHRDAGLNQHHENVRGADQYH